MRARVEVENHTPTNNYFLLKCMAALAAAAVVTMAVIAAIALSTAALTSASLLAASTSFALFSVFTPLIGLAVLVGIGCLFAWGISAGPRNGVYGDNYYSGSQPLLFTGGSGACFFPHRNNIHVHGCNYGSGGFPQAGSQTIPVPAGGFPNGGRMPAPGGGFPPAGGIPSRGNGGPAGPLHTHR